MQTYTLTLTAKNIHSRVLLALRLLAGAVTAILFGKAKLKKCENDKSDFDNIK